MQMDSEQADTRKRAKRICFICLSSYPLLAGRNMGFGGGAEQCFTLLANELGKRGYDVSFITYSDGGEPVEYISNIRVIKIYKRDDVPHLSRPVKARYIWQALRKADADICMEGPAMSGVVPLFCRLKGKKSVRFIASDAEVLKTGTALTREFFLSLFDRLNIKLVHSITVQSEYQRKMLSCNFKRKSTVIKNPLILPGNGMGHKHDPPLVLWVATIKQIKQAELFLELAKAIPETKFQMIGGPELGEEPYFAFISEAARRIPNLDFIGYIPRDKLEPYFEAASILVNASTLEGFPNTFLEAWASYTPVVSLNSDPDEIICRYKLGFHSKTFDQMVKDVKTLLEDPELRDEMGRNGRKYVEQQHDMQEIATQYADLFQQLSN
jgi:glycosyltransferase involved in cell wall biosynthesis